MPTNEKEVAPGSTTPQHFADDDRILDTAFDDIKDAIERAEIETRYGAPVQLIERVQSLVGHAVLNDEGVYVARCKIAGGSFKFDFSGTWAVIATIWDARGPVDLAAFSISDPNQRGLLRGGQFAVGFDAAIWDAAYHPKGRMLMHFDVWSWLRSECTGCLPVLWKPTALAILGHDVPGLVFADDIQAQKAEALIRDALKPPQNFVKYDRVA
jgi:hypothetical protein